jgi:hypothetical protein
MPAPIHGPVGSSQSLVTAAVHKVPNTKLWSLATVVSAFSTSHFFRCFLRAQKYQCTLCPKVQLFRICMPQMQAIFLAATMTFFLAGLFSVSALQLSRRIEQFSVDEN